MIEATFPVRVYQSDDGRWWALVYHTKAMDQHWTAGDFGTWEEAVAAARDILDEAFHTAFYYNKGGAP